MLKKSEFMHLEEKGKWKKATVFAKSLIRRSPKDHWLLTRLSSNYYELRQYRKALFYSNKALKLVPNCPLALWDYACALDMLDMEKKAINIWKRLLRMDINTLAIDECVVDLREAKGLINDCLYRIGVSYSRIGQKRLAKMFLTSHLASRKQGIPSLYSRRRVEIRIKELNK